MFQNLNMLLLSDPHSISTRSKEGSMKFWVFDPRAIRSIIDNGRKMGEVSDKWWVKTRVYGFYLSFNQGSRIDRGPFLIGIYNL